MGAEAAIERRAFIKAASNVAAGVLLGGLASPWIARAAAPFRLPPLPYPENALAPAISANTIGFHYGKHHRAYVDNLNKQVVEMPDLVSLSLIEIVQKTAENAEQKSIFNNAAQAWNHEFYWNSLTPKGGAAPTGVLKDRIDADFGGVAHLKDALRKVSVAQFGSGWGWLVEEDGKLRVVSTSNADTPIVHGQKPLLTIDVWEHAYYLDYQNRRSDYVDAVLDRIINWDFASENLERT